MATAASSSAAGPVGGAARRMTPSTAPDAAPPTPAAPAAAAAPSLASALSTTRALVLVQLLTRALTFALNQALVRLAPPEAFGTAAIQFDLVASTVLFLSREGVRNALLRQPGGPRDGAARSTARQAARLAQVPLHAGLLVSAAAVGLYLSTSASTTTAQPGFYPALALYVGAALLELAVEPHYVRALTSSPPRLRVRVQAEAGAAVTRAVLTAAAMAAARARGGSALLAFAVGQAAGAVWLAGRYIYEFGLDGLGYSARNSGESRFAPAQARLAAANARQAVVKHVLTEADRLAVGRISPLGDQGGYAIAINYGSLIARIVFQPIEESLMLHFARAAPAPASSTPAPPSAPPPSAPAASPLDLLTFVVRLSAHLSLLCPAFVPPLLPTVLPLLLPARYASTTAASTLETYLAVYLPLLSLNGILEAFHAATAAPADVARQARWMAGSSAAFVGALYALTRAGSGHWPGALPRPTTEQALVLASCAAMLVRVAYAFAHARRYAAAHGARPLTLRALAPSTTACAAAFAAAVAVRAVVRWLGPKQGLVPRAVIVGNAAMWAFVVLFVIVLIERAEFTALRRGLGARVKAE